MTTARSERPRFFDGQYLGAADLAATVDHARELAREAALGGQTWGICIGLDLVEVANPAGGFDYFVLPGLAFDGYGRPIVVLSPAPVPAALFADFPTGHQQVWIRHDEVQNRGMRPGWQSCDASDAYARVRESFAIEAGPLSLSERQSGVDVAGGVLPDARLTLNAISPEAPLICDASAPHQTFPADSARWLVPLGAASWIAGAPGALGERNPEARKLSRSLRRYVGQVAESLYAADGVLRLRDRMTDPDDTRSTDEQCSASALVADDLVNAVDPADATKTVDRLIGAELVWVEGHMRVIGDARLWGTKLEFRDGKGKAGIPLHLNRAATANAENGQDLDLTLGHVADGKTRLLAGPTPAGQPIEPRLQLRNDGRLAVGATIPADVKAHTILAYTAADTSVAVGAGAQNLGKLQFTVGAALNEVAHLGYDGAAGLLRLGAGTHVPDYVYMTRSGQVGIRTSTPGNQDADASDLVIRNPANVGMTLQSDADLTGRINFADGDATPAERHGGSLLYRHAAARMEFWTAAAARAALDGNGNLGLGTLVPGARLQIQSPVDARQLKVDADRIQAENGGPASQLELQPNGGGLQVGGALALEQRVVIGADGRIGIGAAPALTSLHVRQANPEVRVETTSGTAPRLSLAAGGLVRGALEVDPGNGRTRLLSNGATALTASGARIGINLGGDAPSNHLHVRGSIDGDAFQIPSHVALIENVATTTNADVLALRVATGAPDQGNNFLTLFGGSTVVGRIEGLAGGTQFQSGAGDFAECLRRDGVTTIGPGRIVGVRGGRISLGTDGAEALMVTTDRAAVVGNFPFDGDRDQWEQVAMVGQVPVYVEGAVQAGDWVLPSGRHDGTGRAVRSEALTAADALEVVGRAWESCARDSCRRVLVAVGVAGATAASAAAGLLAAQATRIAALEARLDALAARLPD